jgi:hypothetical protein
MGDKFDLDKLEFEDIPPEPKDDTSSQEEAVSFSIKIIDVLDVKMRDHNKSSSNKVTLNDLKEVYSHGAKNCHQTQDEDKNCGLWALARVNMFLRLKSGERMNNFSLADSQSLDISDGWVPSENDFENAAKEMRELGLEYNFSSVEELYLDNYQRIDWEW